MSNFRRHAALAAGVVLAGTGLAACGSGNDGDSADGLIVGTTDKVVSIDPAGSYDNGSLTVQTQVYQYLLNFPAGTTDLEPDAAEKCEYTEPTVYTCTLKSGLKFANGNALTASDVKFSFDRVVAISDPNGPSSLLGNLEKTEVVDDTTVAFTLKSANDVTFPQILVTSAGPIVDEETYPADKVLSDDEAVEANGFSGPYTIAKYTKNEVAQFKANPDYDGTYGDPATDTVTLSYYADSNNLKLDVQNGKIDVAYRSLSPTDVESLEKADGVKVHTGPGGELRYIVFNLKTQPGDTDAQKLAIRKAIASSVNRQEIATQVYKDTYTPAYSAVPQGQPGATESFKDLYGDAPDKDAAAKFLADAGVESPVKLNLEWNPDHYGPGSGDEYALVERQLEATGLFDVQLDSQEWVTYSEERVKDAYPVFQLGWFPDFPDPDNYLTPFFDEGNFLESHYADKTTSQLLADERVDADATSRAATLKTLQDRIADQVPILPLLTGAQVAVAGSDVKGVTETLDPSFKFRFTTLAK